MKKRLVCLLLCLVFLLSAFLTGCSKKTDQEAIDDTTEAASEDALTLTMWVVTEGKQKLDSATAAAINDALNTITNSKFKVKLVVKFLTESEYRSTLDNTIRAYENTKIGIVEEVATEETSGEAATDELVTNEWGVSVIRYPELVANQVDIIYIEGEDMYLDYINNGWLASLDEEMIGDGKKLYEYVSTQLLTAAYRNGGTYAIPNNHAIGEYTFLLLDKELMEETSTDAIYKQGKITGLFNDYMYNYFDTLYAKSKTAGNEDIVPIGASYDDCMNLLAHYWNINPDTLEEEDGFSFLGYYYAGSNNVTRSNTVLGFNSLFTNSDFTENYLKLNEYRLSGGFFSKNTTGKRVGAKIATGSYEDYVAYTSENSDYYPVIIKNPTVTSEDVYSSMFGVCKYTRSVSRSMKIITYLNTNADFRNLLQYGIEGENYRFEMDPDDSDKRILTYTEDNTYHMDIFKSGNAFLCYPTPDMDEDIWTNGKLQNLAVTGADPLLDFDFASNANASGATNYALSIDAGSNYAYRFSTGYGKDVLSQNSVLKDWINSCDSAGKGVYEFNSTATSGQFTTQIIYFYNNTGSYNNATIADSNGQFTLEYGKKSGSLGYEISILNVYRKKSASIDVATNIGGVPSNLSVKTQNSLIKFDTFDTDTYFVRLTSNLQLNEVSDNAVVWNWYKSTASLQAAKTPSVLTYQKRLENGNTLHTFLVYASNVSTNWTAYVTPIGTKNNPQIEMNLSIGTSGSNPSGKNYAFFLVTVETDRTVSSLGYTVKVDGQTANTVVTEATADPKMIRCGKLDTSLIRFTYELNEDICAKLAACGTIAEMKALIAELKVLLNPETDAVAEDFTLVADLIEKYGMSEISYRLDCATSTDSVERSNTTDTVSGETYSILTSPYAFFYNWMSSNNYISK